MTEVLRGPEALSLDANLRAQPGLDREEARAPIWASASSLLSPLLAARDSGFPGLQTGIAIGYVQSGKTTNFTALTALASDNNVRLIVALLGSTDLLLEQNTARLAQALRLEERHDYRWVHMHQPNVKSGDEHRLESFLTRDRTVLVTILKRYNRIRDLVALLDRAATARAVDALVIDDEADQISLNSLVNDDDESRAYEELGNLRERLGRHVYVQYTATPYAPLLLEAQDFLSPTYAELLEPGEGYTGGRAFFVDDAATVVRPIAATEAISGPPTQLPSGLIAALASFLIGAAHLRQQAPDSAPVSMLVHPSARNAVQSRYHYLLDLQLQAWRSAVGAAAELNDLPQPFLDALADYYDAPRPLQRMTEADLLVALRFVVREAYLWLVNSQTSARRIRWNLTPVHILVGGNKLDRGFTVEGLTVTYMNRPASEQVDTLEQRARAFGYRTGYLPYCRFFATESTIRNFTDIVQTELDMRVRLAEWLASGRPLSGWADAVGFVIAPGQKATRDQVVRQLQRVSMHGWHYTLYPSFEGPQASENRQLVSELPWFDGGRIQSGQLVHPAVEVTLRQLHDLLAAWHPGFSPTWRKDEIMRSVKRLLRRAPGRLVPVALLRGRDGGPRVRGWSSQTGFSNLMQGRDEGTQYAGDTHLFGEDRMQLLIHEVVRRDTSSDPVHVLALRLERQGGVRVTRTGP